MESVEERWARAVGVEERVYGRGGVQCQRTVSCSSCMIPIAISGGDWFCAMYSGVLRGPLNSYSRLPFHFDNQQSWMSKEYFFREHQSTKFIL